MVYFFQQVVGEPVVGKEVLSRRTNEYQGWVEAFARNHRIAIEWAEPKVRKEDYVRPALRRMERAERHGVYFILKSMEQGQTFRSTVSPVCNRRSQLPQLGSPAEPLHALLLLHP